MADSTTENNAANVNEVPNNQEDAPAREPARELFFDWPINVVVSEPKILSPDPDIAQQGKNVQKLGPLWKTVRYADTKRQFESTAPFCALLVNHELESLTPRCKSFDMLQRFDQTLAAITHGLLKQRKVLQSALDCLPAEARNTVQNALQSADSQYKKISDDLLQYVCGRRSQVIQHRREMFLPRKIGVREALHAIPPTDLVLFESRRLTQLVEALPDKIDSFVPNTDKCRCCQFHKQRRRQSSEESQEDEPVVPDRKRHRKQRRQRNSSDDQSSEDEARSRGRKRQPEQRKRRHTSEARNSGDDSRPRRRRR
ncbi:uncharacterized protein LOC134653423 [Cydia amplana]|uniref:uncharacterized protein LOC134653423 n=1 Tax=Cydia amplana TaxID=1869771 RepID=UPI002FE5B848